MNNVSVKALFEMNRAFYMEKIIFAPFEHYVRFSYIIFGK